MSGHTTRVSFLARLAGGEDELAWQEFCHQYGDLIRRVALRRGLQPADGDDVVQDVLLMLQKAMPGFEYDRGRGTFRGYLKTVTIRAVAARFRRKSSTERIVPFDGEPGPAAVAWPEADAVWEEEWHAYHVMRAMQTIEIEFGEKDRTAFLHFAREGRSAREVAAGLGITEDRVYQAKSRIVRRLQELIAAQIEEEG